MFPTLFKIPLPDVSWLPPQIEIRGYGLMLALGFISAILVAMWRCRREGESPEHIYNLGIMAIVGGVVGARFFDVLEYAGKPPRNLYVDWTAGFNIFDGGVGVKWLLIGLIAGGVLALFRVLPWTQGGSNRRRWIMVAAWAVVLGLVGGRAQHILEARGAAEAAQQAGAEVGRLPYQGFIEALEITTGGLTVYGGLILATLLIVPYLVVLNRRHGINPLKLADIIAPSLALGLAFGRMGCFFNGCCWGGPSDLPWAFIWPTGSLPHNALGAVPLHPAQIYGVINALLLFLLLHLAYRHRPRHGVLMGAFFGLYAISRFLLEWLRLDEPKEYAGGLNLTISQTVSLVALVPIILYFLILPRLKASRITADEASASDVGTAAAGGAKLPKARPQSADKASSK